jgi:riboflavin synthase
MFTGLIEAIGVVSSPGLAVDTPLARDLAVGESVAVNGVCLTVTGAGESSFSATLSPETMRVTTLGELTPGRAVNLERALRADSRLGGHFVLGHVDGIGRISSLEADADCYWLDVALPASLRSQLIAKGSIAIDGISLTIAQVLESGVRIQIVPFTWAHTALSSARTGQTVNIETDVIGKYVARLLADRGTVQEWSGAQAIK